MGTLAQIKLGRKIREVRQKQELTQEKLAELTNIDYKYIQKIEGKNPPDIRVKTILRIADALRIKPSKLLDF